MQKLKLNLPQKLVLSFLFLIIIGSALLCTPWAAKDGTTDWLTAVFTATSAVCVTGLVVVDTGTYWTMFGQFIIMLLIQLGGLGVMSFATFIALALGKRIHFGQRLLMQRALNLTSVEGIVGVFRYLLIFSFIIELVAGLILAVHWSATMGFPKCLWYGFFHAVSAFNNAGFDLMGGFSSLTGFTTDFVTNIIISILVIFGGLGFIVAYEIYNYHNVRRISLHSKVVLIVSVFFITVGTTLIMIMEYNHALVGLTPAEKVLAAYFQAITPRTAGFNTVDLGTLILPTQLLLMFFMFVGGSPGSTAGGIKTTTFAILGLAIYSIFQGNRDTEIFRRRIDSQEVSRALAIALLALLLIFLITFLISLTHLNKDFLIILFEVVSALGTVGLSLGLTTELNEVGRILIIIAMILGRLGPITIGYALILKGRKANIRYPEGKIMIG